MTSLKTRIILTCIIVAVGAGAAYWLVNFVQQITAEHAPAVQKDDADNTPHPLPVGAHYDVRVQNLASDDSKAYPLDYYYVQSYTVARQSDGNFKIISKDNYIGNPRTMGANDNNMTWVFVVPKLAFLKPDISENLARNDVLAINETIIGQMHGWVVGISTEGAYPQYYLTNGTMTPTVTATIPWITQGKFTQPYTKDPVWTGWLDTRIKWQGDADGNIWQCCTDAGDYYVAAHGLTVQEKTNLVLIKYIWPGKDYPYWRDNAYDAMAPYLEKGYRYVSDLPFDTTPYGPRYEIQLVKEVAN